MRSDNRVRAFVLLMLTGVLLIGGGAQAADMVPLKGKFAGAEFSGTFSHLGHFQRLVDLSTGQAVWTAADGDTVTAQTLSFVPDFGNPITPTLFPYTQTIAITGGTGRFAGATGFVSVTGTIDVVVFEYDGLVNGTISRPNSGS